MRESKSRAFPLAAAQHPLYLTSLLEKEACQAGCLLLKRCLPALVIAEVGVAVWAHLQISAFKNQFLTTLDFESLEMWSEVWDTPNLTQSSTFWFDIHYLVFALLLVAAVLLTVNVIWKRRLMQGESALLAGKAV